MARSLRALPVLLAVLCARAQTARYELRGQLLPATHASVWLHGATSPFEESTLAGDDGRFRFHDLLAGTYTLGAFVPGRGEVRRTIEVGPSQASSKNRIELTLELHDGEFESRDSLRRQTLVSAKALAIPERAHREYDEAEKRLARRDTEGAVAHLERAVELAPQYSEAWNHLGTIAYQGRDYARAETCFQKALDADHEAFQPPVNLGGVSINLGKFELALNYNRYAVSLRPNDALANSQLGMSYFYLGKLELAEKYLTTAKQIDPAHFSHPQLMLAEIALRRQDRKAAAAEMAEFLQYHPDAPDAAKIKEKLAQFSTQPDVAKAFAATGMARTFSLAPDLPPLPGSGKTVDAAIGSGRHMRVLLGRSAHGGWVELPLAWYPEVGGHYAAPPAFRFSQNCLTCHARESDDRTEAFGCANCHATAGSGKPAEAVCLTCHVGPNSPSSGHGPSAAVEDRFELNSAGYRLLESRCYQVSAGKLTCTTCHPAHSFANSMAGYRMVCRGCHPTMHNGAPLECPRCHMPKHPAQDAPGIMVTDHRIQRPL